MTNAELNALGARLLTADADGDAGGFHAAAYDLLAMLAEEHARADSLAARIGTLARKAEAAA